MLRRIPLLSVLLLLGACAGGGSSEAPGRVTPSVPTEAQVGKALATVNGFPVGALSFDALAQRRVPADGKAFSDAEKREILDQAITDELLFQEAFGRGLFHDVKVRKILINNLLRVEIYDNVRNEDFTDDQLKAWYDAHKAEFDVPEKIQIKRIFLAISPERDEAATQALAGELVAKIKADPEKFADLAIEHSSDPFARRGGDLGYVGTEGKPGIPAELVQAAFQLAVGETSAVLPSPGGLNILHVANKRERVERTFEQMRGSVLRRAKNEKFEELSKAFVEKLKVSAKIAVDEAALGSYAPAPVVRAELPEGALGGPPAGAPPPPGAPGEAPPGAPGEPPADPTLDLGRNEAFRQAVEQADREEK
jgi:peptidyl-prolyl cis-trans isomerase C